MKINLSTVLLIIALIAIGIVSFFAYKFYNDKNMESQKVEDLSKEVSDLKTSLKDYQDKVNTISNVVNNDNSKKETSKSENISSDIYKINISNKDKFKSLYYIQDFNSISELTTKDMIYVAGVAIYKEFVEGVKGTKVNEYPEMTYTVADVKSVVYAIFGVEINENMSGDSIIYENGRYILNPGDGDAVPSRILNLNEDVADGTTYYTYDLFGVGVAGIEEDMGSYQVGINNGIIQSKKTIKKPVY